MRLSQIVLSKAADLSRNHDVSIKLLAVSEDDTEDTFDRSKFWQSVVAEQSLDGPAVLESLTDLAQNIKSLTRPTALPVPSGRSGIIFQELHRMLIR